MAGNMNFNLGESSNGTTSKATPKKTTFKDYEVDGIKYKADENGNFEVNMDDFYEPYGGKIFFDSIDNGESEAILSEKGDKAPYYFVGSNGEKKWVDTVENAPNGFTVYMASQSPKTSKGYGVSKGLNIKQARAKKLKEEKERREALVKGHIQSRKDEQKKAEQTAIENKSKKEKADSMSYSQLISDEGFNMGSFTTPEMLLKAATEEKIPYKQFISEVNNSKWITDKRLQDAIDKYYPEEVRDDERKKVWDVYKEQNPKANFSDFVKLYESKDKSLDDTYNLINQRESDAKAEEERKAKEIVEADEKRVKELEKMKDKVKSEADKRIADAETERLAREFERKYPIPIAQFWNSGWDWKKKVMLLGELLANFGANITKGALAGFHGQTYQGETSPTAQYFRNALAAQNERNQMVNTESAKSQANAERRNAIMKTSSKLSDLGDAAFQKVSLLLEGQKPSLGEFSKIIKELEPFRSEKEIKDLYEEFGRARTSYIEGSTNYSAELSTSQAEENLKSTKAQNLIKNSQDATAYVQTLMKEKQALQQALLDIEKNKEDDFWKAANYVMDFFNGVEIVNNSDSGNTSSNSNSSASSSSGYSETAGLSSNLGYAGYAGIGANASNQTNSQNSRANGSSLATSKGYANGKQVQLLQKLNIPVAKENGKEFLRMTESSRNALRDAINQQIKYIDEVLLPEAESIRQNIQGTRANDGIIKAPNMKQWIVREDGSYVELNPNDNIYATLNDITTSKDEGQEVVQMNQTDSIKILNKLGYDGQNPINKDFDYYLTKLKMRG